MMWRFVLSALVVVMAVGAAHAQPWDPRYQRDSYDRPVLEPFDFSDWDDEDDYRPRRRRGRGGWYDEDDEYYRPRRRRGWEGWYDEDDEYYRPRRRRRGPELRSGGARPAIAPITPRRISFPSPYEPGSIVIDTKGRQLFLVQSATTALYYPIGVGRIGFSWTGTETISRKARWPDWYPPAAMRAREPHLPKRMSGGIKNPLGAAALYLGNTLYRIHGTNDAKSIGRATSSGCFRMLNGHAVDLASRVEIGAKVTVVKRLPPELARLVTEQVGSSRQRASNRPAGRS